MNNKPTEPLRRRLGRAARVALSVACCVALVTATGCRDSDALKEILYDQTSEIIDYDNEDKFLINDPEATEESDEVSDDEASAVNRITDLVQNIVVYSSEPNATQYKAKNAIWDADPDFTGIEANLAVNFYEDEEEEQDEEETPEETADVVNGDDSDGNSVSSTSTEGDSESDDGENSDEGSEGTGESEGEGDTSSSEATEDEAEDGQGAGYDGKVDVVDTTSDFTDPPSVDHIAAFGQLAVIVQMIGGEGALVAADYELLSEDGFQTVFADEGAGDIVQGWSEDGEDAGTIDVQAIIDSGADTILVSSSTYADELSAEDSKALEDAGVTMTTVSSLVSSSLIKSAVKTVGKMLADSTEIGNAGNTTSLASEYAEFHDDLVDACISANGDTLASYNSKVFEKRNTNSYRYDNSADWTLLIDAWDTSVRYKDGSLTMNGIGLTNLGYATTPVSYYIQVGGLVNSAAAKGGTTYTGLFAVWQFSSGYRAYKSNFTYATNGLFDESITSTSKSKRLKIASSSWGDVFLCVATDSEVSISGTVGGLPPTSFGTDSFPSIIAATQEIKELLIENSQEEDGAYHAYAYIADGAIGAYYGPEGDYAAWGCIGADSSNGNVFSDGSIPDDSVYVNPHGLFASWTESGSVESVLEAAWVNDVVNDDSSETVGWKDYVKEFYSTFYRYDLSSSELSTIEDGLES